MIHIDISRNRQRTVPNSTLEGGDPFEYRNDVFHEYLYTDHEAADEMAAAEKFRRLSHQGIFRHKRKSERSGTSGSPVPSLRIHEAGRIRQYETADLHQDDGRQASEFRRDGIPEGKRPADLPEGPNHRDGAGSL